MKKRALSLIFTIVMLFTLFNFTAVNASAASYSVSVTTGKYYQLINVKSKKLLNVYGNRNANNTNVTVYARDKTSGQNFKFVKNGSGYLLIPQCATSRALNIYGNSAKNGSNVCIWSTTKHSTQTWIPEYVPKYSAYILRSANNKSLVLTAVGSSNSSNVCVKTYSAGNQYQLWTCSGLKAVINRTSTNTTTTPSKTTSAVVSPVANRKITSQFQPYYRKDYSNAWSHVGIDYISNSSNDNIYAFYKGTVTKASSNSSVGNYIEIKHNINGKTIYSYYFHLKQRKVSAGTTVSAGQVIGIMGNTGASSGKHLHFQITSASVVNSNGSLHTPTNNNSYRNWSIQKQSSLNSFTSSRGIVFYNPEKVLNNINIIK